MCPGEMTATPECAVGAHMCSRTSLRFDLAAGWPRSESRGRRHVTSCNLRRSSPCPLLMAATAGARTRKDRRIHGFSRNGGPHVSMRRSGPRSGPNASRSSGSASMEDRHRLRCGWPDVLPGDRLIAGRCSRLPQIVGVATTMNDPSGMETMPTSTWSRCSIRKQPSTSPSVSSSSRRRIRSAAMIV